MDNWLDSLSEDWPSRPPSEHNSSSILQNDGSHTGNRNQSRLPRRSGSGFSSISSLKEKDFARRPAAHSNHTTDAPLKERSKSSLNAAQRLHGDNKVQSPRSGDVRKQKLTDDNSESSMISVPTGTVAYKASPKKEASGTPEWKRRVIQGKIGRGDQTDMFGPMGLESVFKPPSKDTNSTKRELHRDLESEKLQKDMKPPNALNRSPRLGLDRPPEHRSTERVQENMGNDEAFLATSSEPADASSKSGLVKSHSKLPVAALDDSVRPSLVSISKPARTFLNDDRNDSNMNDSGSSSFSPVIVSKSHTMDGKVNYAALEHEGKNRSLKTNAMEEMQSEINSPRPELHGTPMKDGEDQAISLRKSQINEITNQSLPEDLSVGTDAYAANGGFVSIRRGGYSNEGSFRQRSLSPSPTKDIDGPRDQSMAFSNQPPPSPQKSRIDANQPSSPPVTPRKDGDERPRSSGSPLKLFDKYDTFTNNRLARHISRIEETFAQNDTPEAISEEDFQVSSPSPGPKVSTRFQTANGTENHRSDRRVKSFGSGELDDVDFSTNETENAELSLPYLINGASIERSLPDYKDGQKCSRESRQASRAHRSVSWQIQGAEDSPYSSNEYDLLQREQSLPTETSYTVNGKRLPDSPKKKIARKRRKTLQKSEEHESNTGGPQQTQPLPLMNETSMPTSNGRKRKDALHGSQKQAADPQTLAMRQILRPRNPTPNQSGSSNGHTPFVKMKYNYSGSTRDNDVESVTASTGPIGKIDPPTQIVAGALATIALNTVQEIETGSRKVSVTTSDFFNEAQQIMALIRAEKRPRSSQHSAETSNLGPSIIHEEDSGVESTKDDLTRPPSREGGSLRHLQLPMQHNARVVSHLRKFEDKDDLGLTLPSSGKSLRISNCDLASVASPVRPREEDQLNDVESDPPNIRIRAALRNDLVQDHLSSKSKDLGLQKDNRNSNEIDSHSSSDSSGRKSVPTGSSQGSANIKKIVPQSVAHLLSDQMAGMCFDKKRQVWIKRKALGGKGASDGEAHASSEATEEDLFGGIPDLSVDEMEELKMVKDVVSSRKKSGSDLSTISAHDQVCNPTAQDHASAPQVFSEEETRPRTADEKMIQPTENSSAPSKHTNFAWSVPMPGTRATSYGDEAWLDEEKQERQASILDELNVLSSPEVEHEISIFDGRAGTSAVRSARQRHQPRVVTVAFSSPLVQSPYQPDEDWDEVDQSRMEESPSRNASQLQRSMQRSTTKPIASGSSRFRRRFSHRLSIGNSTIMARPMSRLDEQQELSLIHYSGPKDAHRSVDLALATPLPPSSKWIAAPKSGHRSSIGFELSPLADFTVHQIDRPLDDPENLEFEQSQVHKVSRALSISAQEILKHLTDLEPFEPYWYYIQDVVFQNRNLTSLHMLDEFCGQIQVLDVSQNSIRELDGVPPTVRSLNIRNNCLSELTSWHGLLHLQYLDLSGNQVRSLKGFQDLIHLRSLTADDNQIESLEGIERLDGLLSLRLRNNKLSSASFEQFNSKRLRKLDLKGNHLNEVVQLDSLESLELLNLSINNLRDFHLGESMPKLLTLNIDDNNLDRIDVTNAPNLRILTIDRNAITAVKGLKTHTRLENLSWREQKVPTLSDDHVEACREIRKLYISSTCFSPTFNFKNSLLNLNTLEMASMGIQSLPEEFGLMCKNLRNLNLNFNAIHDIRPLLGIERLQNLHLAGNRLSRLRRTAAVLDRLSTELTELDFRNNTLTVGFYTPQPPPHAGTGERQIIVHNSAASSSPELGEESYYIAESAQTYLLPALDKGADTISRDRLDEDTKLRRRVYEMLLVSACKSLQRLDGLEVDRRAVGKKDGVWERLVELDVLKPKVG